MRRGHPPFLLAGGEFVVLALGLRIALWVARGWRGSRAVSRIEPGAPGGVPLALVQPDQPEQPRATLPAPPELRRAA